MPIVELQQVCKAYDTKVAVDNISFTIQPGTMFGLLGPNGSGKTSTIRMMIGITVPDSGSVRLFDQPYNRTSLKRVGYLPEERGLYKKMNVLEQLIFLGQLHGLDGVTAKSRAQSWCERLQITESIPKKTEELSKGMQQKIQFIASLMHDPDLIIMDEPFSGLDPVNATLLQDTLVELRQRGKTILFSTHRMDQVERMCDAICLVHNGRLVLSGTMQEVKSRYPADRIQIAYSGNDSFLHHSSVAGVKNYNGFAEIILRSSPDTAADAQALLAHAVMHDTRISRFELMAPTLEDIFIDTVGADHADFDTGSRQHRIPIGSKLHA